MNKTYDMFGVLERLTGSISPIGETNYDAKALDSLEEWKELTSRMIDNYIRVACREDTYQASVKECADSAKDFLKLMYEHLTPYMEQWGIVTPSSEKPVDCSGIYPLTIIKDRYAGVYSGGAYIAFNCYPECVPEDVTGDDISCAEFWQKGILDCNCECVVGNTVNEAVAGLKSAIDFESSHTYAKISNECKSSVPSPVHKYIVALYIDPEIGSTIGGYSGYAVVAASSEEEALEYYENHYDTGSGYYSPKVMKEVSYDTPCGKISVDQAIML